MNKKFEKFIDQTEKLMTAQEKELDEFFNDYFSNDDTKVEKHCQEKHIPIAPQYNIRQI